MLRLCLRVFEKTSRGPQQLCFKHPSTALRFFMSSTQQPSGQSDDAVSQFWKTSDAAGFASRSRTNGRMAVLDRMAELVAPYLQDATLLVDLGCGPLLFEQRLAAAKESGASSGGPRILGVDISETHLAAGQQVLSALPWHGEMVLGDIRTWTTDLKPDIVVHNNCVEDYVQADKELFFANVCGYLKPGGRLFLQVYSPEDEPMGKRVAEVSPAFAAASSSLHLVPLSDLRHLVETCGMQVEHTETFSCLGDYRDRGLGEMRREFHILIARRPQSRINQE